MYSHFNVSQKLVVSLVNTCADNDSNNYEGIHKLLQGIHNTFRTIKTIIYLNIFLTAWVRNPKNISY